MLLIDMSLMDGVSHAAAMSPCHMISRSLQDDDLNSLCFINAMEAGSEISMHVHSHISETCVILRGKIKVLFYDSDRALTTSLILGPSIGVYGINIPAGQWHSIEALENGSVCLDIKNRQDVTLR